MWLCVAIVIALAAILLIKRTFSFWDRHNVPSIPGVFFVGSIWKVMSMKKHLGILSQEWYQKFSNLPFFGYYNGSKPVLMIRDLEIIKDVLIKDFNSFSKNDFEVNEDVDPLLASNPFMASGEKWKHYRSTMSPAFSASRIKSVFPLMKTTCTKFEDYLNDHGSEDHQSRELAAKFTTENSVMCGFTFNAETFTNPDAEFRNAGRKLFEQNASAAVKYFMTLYAPWLEKYVRIPFLPKYVDTFFRKFIKSNIASRHNKPADDLLQTLLQTVDNKKLTENELIGHSLSFFTEGFETSSAVISYAMFELSRNPAIQNKLYDEVTSIMSEHNGDFNYDVLQKMEYLDAIFHETLRLYPVLLNMQKVCTIPYQFRPLPNQKNGYKMPIGGIVSIPVHAIHRDPEYYPNPDVFNPDRFLTKQRQAIPKGAFLGFGEGPRMCVGMRFGQIQAKAALLTIIKSFRIKLSPASKPYKIDPAFFMNAPLHPILLNFEKR